VRYVFLHKKFGYLI